MTNEDIRQKIQNLKKDFRLMMDGATASQMREKGLNYKVNWGATLPRLKELASGIGQDYSLAVELWKENTRECKILATMLMPVNEMTPDLMDIWMEQTPNVEIAEQAVFNLYQHLNFSSVKAFLWLSTDDVLKQVTAYHILSRLFMKNMTLAERDINEYIDQALTALQSDSTILQKAAMQSLIHFAELGLVYQRIAQNATKNIGYNFL